MAPRTGKKAHKIIPIQTYEGTLPVLFIETEKGGKIMYEQVLLIRHMATAGYSPSQLLKQTESIGRLWDWLVFGERQVSASELDLAEMFRRFLVARHRGTLDQNGNDPTSLNWRSVKVETVEADRTNINKLSKFVSEELGYFPLNSGAKADFDPRGPAFKKASLVLSGRSHGGGLLGHLRPSHRAKPIFSVGPVARRKANPDGDSASLGHDVIQEIIESEKSVTKRMIYIELAYSGSRISEALHHYLTDVLPGSKRPLLFPDDHESIYPLLVHADPSRSTFTDTLELSVEDRKQFLFRVYRSVPRNELSSISEPLHIGWKGMLFDNPNLLISQAYWASSFWATRFGDLFGRLLDIRRLIPDEIRKSHPYLYINDDPSRKEFGLPIKISNIEKSFARSCMKAGIKPYKNKASLHGLRHSYKKLLQSNELPPGYIQRCMHHISPESQQAYGRSTAFEINQKIKERLT